MLSDPIKNAALSSVENISSRKPPAVQKQELPGESSPALSIEEKVDINKKALKNKQRREGEAAQHALMNDPLRLEDGYDSSRDITGISCKEGKPEEPYKFKVSLAKLKKGAEKGFLDMYLLVSIGKGGKAELPDNMPGKTSEPWNIALKAYDSEHFTVCDSNGKEEPGALKKLKFNTLSKSVDFELDKNALRKQGWKDGEPLALRPFTAKDFVKKVTDDLALPAHKPWKNDGILSKALSTDKPDTIEAFRDNNWGDDIIYFLLTDRFSDGDQTNNMNVDKKDLRRYQGGDIQGIIDKLDYIKDLGVSTIWLTPVMDNQTSFVSSDGYHGYWPIDFFKVDEHQGDTEKFKEMVDKAHEKGLKVILDMPLNHVAWEHPWKTDPSKHNWFHHIGDIIDWENEYQIEHGSMYGLPDLAQENPDVEKYLVDMCKHWVDVGIDGFRLDAVRHVNRNFWKNFNKAIRDYAGPDFLLIGEDMHGVPGHVGGYQSEGMTSLFDMPLYFTFRDVFAKDGSMKELGKRLEEEENAYDNPEMMGSFLDNHDMPRFMTMAGDNAREKFKLALSCLLTINRIPTIYYGTEVGMKGNLEFDGKYGPENRAMMEWNSDPELLNYFKKLTSVRNNSIALKNGALLEMWRDDQVYAYSRTHPDEEVIVALNNSYSDQNREIPLRQESIFKEGTVLKDVLSGEEVTVRNGKINVHLHRKEPKIFMEKR